VLGAARGLGLAVVCEGIENLDTARAVRDLGAWAGQGFALHAAMASADFQRVLTLPPAPLREQARAR
jgi:EAL domain-containing protein (putative c-di-GMP-specific phosphodiesterase class I)